MGFKFRVWGRLDAEVDGYRWAFSVNPQAPRHLKLLHPAFRSPLRPKRHRRDYYEGLEQPLGCCKTRLVVRAAKLPDFRARLGMRIRKKPSTRSSRRGAQNIPGVAVPGTLEGVGLGLGFRVYRV